MNVCVGEDFEDFDGYYAILYENTERVLLENSEKGNAAFVLFQDWEELSKLTKQELGDTCRGKHARVCHTDGSDWKGRIRLNLNLK